MPRVPTAPPELTVGPFLARQAIEKKLLTPKQLRSRCWRRVLPGVYVHDQTAMDDEARLDALRLVVRPGRVVIGRTAAWLHSVWTPRPGSPVPLETSDPLSTSGFPVLGLERRRLTIRGGGPDLSLLDQDVVDVGGMPVLSAWRTCFDLMRERSLVEAVVVADAFAWAGVIDLPRMAVFAADRRRWPGVREARVALNLANACARSPGETRARMVVVLAGLPEPFVNVPLLDSSGHMLGIPDLTVYGRRRSVGIEYDGAYHDDEAQQGKDRRRENGLGAMGGLPLLRYDRTSVLHERQLMVSQVATAIGSRPTHELLDRDFRRPPPRLAW